MTQTESHKTYPKGEESRLRLLDAALRVFRAKGYAATRVEDVCAAAGLTKGGFFHHFSGKEDLALAAAARFGALAEALFAEAPFRAPADPAERVLAYVDFRAALMRGGALPEVTCYLGTMVQETYATHPALRDACHAAIEASVADLARDIAAARARHCPEAEWRPESLAAYVMAAIQGAFVLAKAEARAERGAEMLGHLRRHLAREFGLQQGERP